MGRYLKRESGRISFGRPVVPLGFTETLIQIGFPLVADLSENEGGSHGHGRIVRMPGDDIKSREFAPRFEVEWFFTFPGRAFNGESDIALH